MKKLSILLVLISTISLSKSQIYYQPYSFQHYQNFASTIYTDTVDHTAVKPFVRKNLHAEFDLGNSDSTKGWLHRKIFQEHLIEVVKPDHSFYVDFLPDFLIGRQSGTTSKDLWTNTRGVQAGLSVKEQFSFYFSFFENQARFPSHIDETARAMVGLPGQGFSEGTTNGRFDWRNTTANLTYQVAEAFNVNLAYDKIHIGEGYRSVLLAESPYNFTHLKLSGKLGRFQYNSIWATMLDRQNPNGGRGIYAVTDRPGDGTKFAAFQYLDYLLDKNATIGLFHSLIWTRENIIGDQSINGGVGLNAKYQPFPKVLFYGQVYADDLSKFSLRSNVDRRVAYQFGGKAFDLFAVKSLNFTLEYNQAAPYTYQQANNQVNYSSNGEPLAHPAGANFREVLGIMTYTWNRFNIYGQSMFSRYGIDPTNESNYGRDLFKEGITTNEFQIGQGQTNNLFYNELRVAYILNPKYNLRFELGLINRNQRNLHTNERVNANIFTIGLRSTFRTFQTEY